jgi:hypothetical protein
VAAYAVALDMLVVAIHFGIALVVVWRRPDHSMCLLVAFALSINGAVLPLALVRSYGSAGQAEVFLSGLVIYLGLVTSIALLYLFPDGRFVPRWTSLLAALWAALTLPAIFFPEAVVSLPRWPLALQVLALVAWTATGAFAQIYRYLHVASPVERQQVKWGVLGILAAALAPFAYFLPVVIIPSLSGPRIPNMVYQQVGAGFFAFSFFMRLIGLAAFAVVRMLFPVSFAVAILRYRLWDIDLIIRRTLIYAVLTATLALIYLVSVILLEALLRGLTGGTSQLAVVASTLAIAALFVPLRERVQDIIDRRFYRRKYDAAKTLAAFTTTVRDKTDLDQVTSTLLDVVRETVQPEEVSLWLRQDDVIRNP